DGRFGFYANDKVAEISQLSDTVVELAPQAVTLGSDGVSAAVLGQGGAWLVSGSSAPLLADDRMGLVDPSLDEDGYLWSVPRFEPNGVVAVDQDGTRNPVAAGLPADSQVESLEISREGARAAVL